MNLVLDERHRVFRNEVRTFIEQNLSDDIRLGQRKTTNMYAHPSISLAWHRALQEKGWLVPLWPCEWGGTGWTGLQRFIFETECALAGAPLVHPMSTRLVGPVLLKFGTDDQKRRYLPRILSSEDYWCQGFSESQAGSDLAALRLRAHRDGDHYILNGSKLWTTHAQFANRMFALVRTSDSPRQQDGISFLLIDMQAPGITVRPIDTIGGDQDVNEVYFDDVRVHVQDRIGEENQGWTYAKYLLEFERGAGIFSPRLRSQLKRILELLEAQNYAWGEEDERRLGDLIADINTFEWLELRTIGGLQPGDSPGPNASVLKLRASRLKQQVAEMGVDLLGTDALRWEHSDEPNEDAAALLVREYCNSRAYTIFGGAAEIQLGLIARTLLK